MSKHQNASKRTIKITTDYVIKVTKTKKIEIVEGNKKTACTGRSSCKR